MNAQINETKLAELIYLQALETGEVDERDKEAVIIGALWALRLPKDPELDDML